MLLQVFGAPDQVPRWWFLNAIPVEGGREIAAKFRQTHEFFADKTLYLGATALDELSYEDLKARISTDTVELVARHHSANPRPSRHIAQAVLSTQTGPDAGRLIPIPRGTTAVGRAGAQIQIRDHLLAEQAFTVESDAENIEVLEDGRSRSSSYKDSWQIGATEFELTPPADPGPLTTTQPRDFQLDAGPEPTSPNLVLQAVMALAPMVIGVVMMVVTGMWYFLLFSGLSIIIAAAMTIQYRRARREFIRAISAEVDRYREHLEGCAPMPVELSSALGPTQVRESLTHASGQDWPQEPVVLWGHGIQQGKLRNITSKTWAPFLRSRLPLITSLGWGEKTIVVDSGAAGAAILRWAQTQLAIHCLATGTRLSVGEHELVTPPAGQPERLLHEIIIDFTGQYASTGVKDRQHIISLVKPGQHVPADLRLDLTSAIAQRPGLEASSFYPLGISSDTSQQLLGQAQVGRPVDPSLEPVLGIPEPAMSASAVDSLIVDLDATPNAPSVDLTQHGPHLLITGTTGSGKSELLLTLIGGLVAHYPPAEVSLILLDFKGGASFGVFEQLPHTMVLETNHLASHSIRSLEAISAELARRERLFRSFGVPDYVTFRTQNPHIPLPRLVVAIDELKILLEDNADASTALTKLAATGRSLGFHLVLSTQTAHGTVGQDIRANLGSILCLRTATEQQSWDVINSADAYLISPSRPGEVLFKVGSHPPQRMRVGRYSLANEPVRFGPFVPQMPPLQSGTTDWVGFVDELLAKVKDLGITPVPPVILPALPEKLTAAQLRHEFGLVSEAVVLGLIDDPHNQCHTPVVLESPANVQPSGIGVDAGSSVARISGSIACIGLPTGGIDSAFQTLLSQLDQAEEGNSSLARFRLLTTADSGFSTTAQTIVLGSDPSEALQAFLEDLDERCQQGGRLRVVIQQWDSWAQQPVAGNFEVFEELLMKRLTQYAEQIQLVVFGGRVLASGRLVTMIAHRIYLPTGVTSEQRMLWPDLVDVPAIPHRGVLIGHDFPAPGKAIQVVQA